jgi:outer membrane protein TolC
LKKSQAKIRALENEMVLAEQLPDPMISVKAMNLPTDTFRLDQENMTQIQVGIQQMFPKGSSRKIHSEQKKSLGIAEEWHLEDLKAKFILVLRKNWFNLFYWIKSKEIILDNKSLFEYLVKSSESKLKSGSQQEHEVLRARLELSKIENQLILISQNIETERAKLSRLIGAELAALPLPLQLPNQVQLDNSEKPENELNDHPIIKRGDALIELARQEVRLAEEQYKPGWSAGIHYGFRQGNTPMGGERSNFVSVNLNMDLPIFTSNRQDRKLQASEEKLMEDEFSKTADYQRLSSELSRLNAIWKQTQNLHKHYNQHLLPEANQHAEATLIAYQNNLTDFSAVARSHIINLNAQLEDVKISIEIAKTASEILYLLQKG